MNDPHQAFVALGANLGDPVSTLKSALEHMGRQAEIRLLATSSLYRTAPIGFRNQPDFINAVVQIETSLNPQELLAALLALENDFGRQRLEKNGPRKLDLDLLLFDDLILETPTLKLPHPRLHLRAFVLAPLAEIAPQSVIPGRGSLSAWLPAVANQSIMRIP